MPSSTCANLNAAAPDKPFFVYYVPGGTHSPHQPTKEWIDKFKGKFDMGYEKLREQIFANQKRLGVIPPNTQLTPWPDGQAAYGGAKLPRWDSLSSMQKKLYAREAEVFAAYAAYTDHEIGRVIQEVQDEGKLDNTLIIYICGDNGTSAEGTLYGTFNQMTAYNGILDAPDASAVTALRRLGLGQDLSAYVGAMVVGVRHSVQVDQAGGVAFRRHATGSGHFVARSHHRRRRHPHAVPPCHRYRADDPRSHRHQGARGSQWHQAEADRRREHGLHVRQGECQCTVEARDAVFRDGRQPRDLPRRLDCHHDSARRAWLLGTGKLPDLATGYKWELYHIAEDYSQYNDLAAKMPDKLKEMQALFLTEAAKYKVFPLDNTGFARLLTPRPSAVAGKTVFTYTGENAGIPVGNAPSILDKDYTITAEVTIPEGGAEGMIVTLGGRFGGYGLYLLKGKPVFDYNLLDLTHYRWEGGTVGPRLCWAMRSSRASTR